MPSVIDQGIVGYMCDNGNNYPFAMNSMRIIIGSCSNMVDHFNIGHERDDAWLILPGYKLVVYRRTSYGGDNPATLDNSDGQYPKMFILTSQKNRTKSFKAYYKGSGALPDITSSEMYVTGITGPAD